MLVLLDRDGVFNDDRSDFVKSPDEFVPIPGSLEAVARLNAAGHLVAVVTNRSVVGRGLIDEEMLARIHHKLHAALHRANGHIDALIHCSDSPWQATDRRKPGAGMLREAMTRFGHQPGECVMIGDSLRDLQAAATAGIRRILVRTGQGARTQAQGVPPEVLPVSVYDNLAAAVDALLSD